jgi:N-acetylneuraminate synthase
MSETGTCFIIAEIGINHNGDIELAENLIRAAHYCGANAVKFQKRTVEVVYSNQELSRYRESPFGDTNGDLKRGLEFGLSEYKIIDKICEELQIPWFASPWDEESVDFLMQFDVPYIKLASASVTDKELVKYCCGTGKPLIISTGMCDMDLVHRVVDYVDKCNGKIEYLMHCTSTYPTEIDELNLLGITTLKKEYPNLKIGYSGHEPGVPPSIMAAVLGAEAVERHFTLNRTTWGSDQAASLEPQGFARLVRDIRTWEIARGDGKIKCYGSEVPIMEKLRRKNTIYEE